MTARTVNGELKYLIQVCDEMTGDEMSAKVDLVLIVLVLVAICAALTLYVIAAY